MTEKTETNLDLPYGNLKELGEGEVEIGFQSGVYRLPKDLVEYFRNYGIEKQKQIDKKHIQNAERRLKEEISCPLVDEMGFEPVLKISEVHKIIDKIFSEEFGEKLT